MSWDFESLEPKRGMTTPARKLGEKLAQQYFKTPPIDVEWLAVNHFHLKLRKRDLPDHVSGKATPELGEIAINTKRPIVHQRFTIAHELGHIALDHGKRKWSEYAEANESSPDKPLEEEANAYAAGLLTPSYMLTPLVKQGKRIDELATLFLVSTESLWLSLDKNRLLKFLSK